MIRTAYRKVSEIIADDLKLARTLLFLVSAAFLIFAVFAANAPLRGPLKHQWLNYLPAATAFVSFILMAFTKWGIENRQKLVTFFIYEINLINVYLLYATQHMDLYSYQFIIGYVVSSYFFRSFRGLIGFVLVINAAVVLTAFTSHANSNSPIDFYLTYSLSQLIFFVLFRYRFAIENRLLESEKKYRLLAENSFDLICVHNVKGVLEFVSPSSQRLLGYMPEELEGRHPLSFVHPDDAYIMKGIQFTDPAHPFMNKPVQYRLRNAKGNYQWFETIFTLMEGSDGQNGVVLSQSRDIRRSKKYQMELEERTHELERSNADLETFAFVSSHDMKEPLRMISNYTQLLKKRYTGKLDADADEYLDFANRGAVQLQQLIHDLLSYSRITRAEIKKDKISMNEVMDELMRNIQLELKEKHARVEYGNLDMVLADKNLLALVMQNLVLNGIKYCTAQTPEVKVSTAVNGKSVTFCVADNGIGIDARHQQRIFEPFHRLHTKVEYPGTGLGLSICKKIIERQGGKIWVESQPGAGARFFFTLPLN